MFDPVFLLVSGFLFFLGASIGSFLNVFVYRTVEGESWVAGRSKCEKCQKQIAWFDNIPLVSFLVLAGRCRNCRAPIGIIHPVVELLTGSLFVWWFWAGSLFFRLTTQPLHLVQPFFWLIVAILLLVILVADLKYYIIPDLAVGLLTFITLLYRFALVILGVMRFEDLAIAVFCMVGLVAFFYSLWFFTKGKGFGFGDVKLAVPLALILGWPKILVAIFLSFLLGGLVGVVLLVLKKKKLGQVVPFGPFLVISTTIALLWGNQIWDWYMHLISV
ncbi:MAG: prepilin peptidase [Patescibacteria group bacterium]